MKRIIIVIAVLAVLVPVMAYAQDKNIKPKSKKELLASSEEDLLLTGGFGATTFLEILKRVGLAAALGAAIAVHPLRLYRRRHTADPLKMGLAIRAQILICSAGALMVIVIAGSLARAFGLVGLGSFVRFRTTLKDPTDLAVMFLLVGIGMACGLAAYAIAVYGAATIMIVLAALEARRSTSGAAGGRVVTLTMKGPEALFDRAVAHVRSRTELRLISFSHKPKKEKGSIVVELPADIEPERVLEGMRPLGEFSSLGCEEGVQ
jgi:hypothetical protein